MCVFVSVMFTVSVFILYAANLAFMIAMSTNGLIASLDVMRCVLQRSYIGYYSTVALELKGHLRSSR